MGANKKRFIMKTLEDDTRRLTLGDLLHWLAIRGALDSTHYLIDKKEDRGMHPLVSNKMEIGMIVTSVVHVRMFTHVILIGEATGF